MLRSSNIYIYKIRVPTRNRNNEFIWAGESNNQRYGIWLTFQYNNYISYTFFSSCMYKNRERERERKDTPACPQYEEIQPQTWCYTQNHLRLPNQPPPPQFQSTADLPDHIYSFPMDIMPTECRPDIVIVHKMQDEGLATTRDTVHRWLFRW